MLSDDVSSEDVTEEYVDLKARLRHWRSQEAQLLEIMRQARKIPDILAVRDQLSAVQQEIERVSGRLRFLENRIDLSTITVGITRKAKQPAPPTIASTWHGGGLAIAAASVQSVKNLVAAFTFLAIALTYILPFAALGAIIWFAIRSARRKPLPRSTT